MLLDAFFTEKMKTMLDENRGSCHTETKRTLELLNDILHFGYWKIEVDMREICFWDSRLFLSDSHDLVMNLIIIIIYKICL